MGKTACRPRCSVQAWPHLTDFLASFWNWPKDLRASHVFWHCVACIALPQADAKRPLLFSPLFSLIVGVWRRTFCVSCAVLIVWIRVAAAAHHLALFLIPLRRSQRACLKRSEMPANNSIEAVPLFISSITICYASRPRSKPVTRPLFASSMLSGHHQDSRGISLALQKPVATCKLLFLRASILAWFRGQTTPRGPLSPMTGIHSYYHAFMPNTERQANGFQCSDLYEHFIVRLALAQNMPQPMPISCTQLLDVSAGMFNHCQTYELAATASRTCIVSPAAKKEEFSNIHPTINGTSCCSTN